MDTLLASRMQMAMSLGFHIIFACVGMVMPFFMARAHYLYLKTRDEEYWEITRMWMKGVAIFFATGAVSGTVLSFELGLLWPEFMKHAGKIIGMPFSWEGTAFFLEAIFFGLFLYGKDRLPDKLHFFFGFMVGVCGLMSGVFVISANSWMNSPSGFEWVGGEAVNIDPVKAMFNDAWFSQTHHMLLASFTAVSTSVMGLHAYLYLKGKRQDLHLKCLKMVMPFFIVASILQPISGDLSAKDVAKRQPLKLAAMEAHFETEKGAPLIIGGIPDVKNEKVDYAIKLPKLLSFLAFADFDAEVKGLNEFPKDEWPPILITHFAFQIMVGIGSLLIMVAFFLIWVLKFKPSLLTHKKLLKLLFFLFPFGFIALEAGWVVTEVGRQPWIIYGIMKTKDAVTPMPGMQYSFYLYTVLYLFLSVMLVWLMRRQIKAIHGEV